MKRALAACALAALGWAATAQEPSEGEAGFSAAQVRKLLQHGPPPPPPPDPSNAFADDPRAALLGQRLFFEPRLSRNGELSCASCHDPQAGFADGLPLSRGLGDLPRHAPSLWNVAHQRWYFWDGRADSLWAQAIQPIESPIELGGNRARLAHAIAEDPLLRREYEQLFGALPPLEQGGRFPRDARPAPDDAALDAAWRGMSAEDREGLTRVLVNAAKAIAAYERRLVSTGAPFDTFLEGLRSGDPQKLAALSESAQRGAKLFVGRGNCRMCHSGPLFSDGEFHDIGIPPPGGGAPSDPGRHAGIGRLMDDPFNTLGAYSDDPEGEKARTVRQLARGPQTWGEFKTPGLRNVALSAPYMHQGQLATLDDVLRYYSTLEGSTALGGHHAGEQVLFPLALGEQEAADLRAFLESLSDAHVDPRLLAPPPRPEDAPDRGG